MRRVNGADNVENYPACGAGVSEESELPKEWNHGGSTNRRARIGRRAAHRIEVPGHGGVSVRDPIAGTSQSLGLQSLRAGVLPRVRRPDRASGRMRRVHGVRERDVRVIRHGSEDPWHRGRD